MNMRKKNTLLFLIFALNVLAAVNLGAVRAEDVVVKNPTILVDNVASDSRSEEIEAFKGNATRWGYTVNVVKEVNDSSLKGIDILIINQNDKLTTAETTAIVDWWEAGYSKTVWLAGDSDYATDVGLWDPYPLNILSVKLGGNIIMQDDALADDESCDGSSYRVISNTTNPDMTDLVKGITQVVTHSPAPIVPYTGDETGGGYPDTFATWDSLEKADWVLNTSKAGKCLEQDADIHEGTTGNDINQFWEGYPNDVTSPDDYHGSFTTFAVQWDLGPQNKSKLIVCGEPTFTDYKFQFGNTSEYGRPHQGHLFVYNVIKWGTPLAKPGATPGFDTMTFLLAFSAVAIIVIRKRK